MVWLGWFFFFFCNYRWLSAPSGQVRRWELWTSSTKSKSIQQSRSATPQLIKVLLVPAAHFRMLFLCQNMLNWLDWSYSPACYQLAHQSFMARDIRWPQAYPSRSATPVPFLPPYARVSPLSSHQATVSLLPLTKQSLDKALIQTAIQMQNGLLEECVRQITVTSLWAFKVRWTEALLTKFCLLNSGKCWDWSVAVMHFSISLSSWLHRNQKNTEIKKRI